MCQNEYKVACVLYRGVRVATYTMYNIKNGKCDITLNLYHPFNRRRVILSDINMYGVVNAVLDCMSLQVYCDTEDCNKLQAYEVVKYLKNQS